MGDARAILDLPSQGSDSKLKKMIIEIMVKPDRQADLARRTDLSAASVSAAIKELTNKGLVETEKGSGSSGKSRGGKVQLRQLRGVVVGVDLGFNHISVVARPVTSSFDQVVQRRETPGMNRGLRLLLPDVLNLIQDAVEETGQKMTDVVTTGLAVPRMVDPLTGTFTPPVLAPWRAEDRPAQELSAKLGVPVAMDNDANLGALAEQTYGSDEAIEHVAYVKASTGVGVGIMIGSILLRGQRGMAGELGHLTIEPDGEMCLCGGRGCLDTIVGAESLVAKAKQAQRGSSRDIPSTLSALVHNAQNGDAVCGRILNDAGRVLGFALAQLCNLINPRHIILGGELAEAGHLVLDTCRQELTRYALTGTVHQDGDFELRTSALSPFAEAQGALILGLQSRSSK
ncbi:MULTISPECIES: ROK family transcriptional regulator [unclassified Crossiella]|uniref:ROK family transcriptional regulator n=1 Tax=unclassified Crossiella TaxID=2620835 RepID=UPI001FFE4B72|nr:MULTISPECIES: ROK family transcriptional regulator [unclassified Crossiella]MCK2242518.1 ROK family protein [Crossiella sp. S99.2]MCK2254452.1 ROK family protein [Crossiella sp. S99.1]